jgi:hypothetical protein
MKERTLLSIKKYSELKGISPQAVYKKIEAQLLENLQTIKNIRETTINLMVENELNKVCGISSEINENNTDDSGFSDAMKLKIATKGNKPLYNIQAQYSSLYDSMLDNLISLNRLLS